VGGRRLQLRLQLLGRLGEPVLCALQVVLVGHIAAAIAHGHRRGGGIIIIIVTVLLIGEVRTSGPVLCALHIVQVGHVAAAISHRHRHGGGTIVIIVVGRIVIGGGAALVPVAAHVWRSRSAMLCWVVGRCAGG